ncbi:MAG: DUF5331 domain-containing protein [Cyanobacteria bacterium J06621_15]
MNIKQLRESLKIKWVTYYHQNRSWLEKMRIWGTYDGYRRPSSGFILATLSVLEPKLDEIFPFILELNNNPDEIIAALGLNFNPEKQSHLIENLDKSVNNHQINHNLVREEIIVDKFRAERNENTETSEPELSDTTAITKIESFPFSNQITSISESESIEKEFQAFSELLQDNPPQNFAGGFAESSMMAQLESEDEILSLLTMCDESEPEEITITTKEETKEETEELKKASRKKASKLASWIDEFCQGRGWDREEAIFIPF